MWLPFFRLKKQNFPPARISTYTVYSAPLENISLIWRRNYCWWQAAKCRSTPHLRSCFFHTLSPHILSLAPLTLAFFPSLFLSLPLTLLSPQSHSPHSLLTSCPTLFPHTLASLSLLSLSLLLSLSPIFLAPLSLASTFFPAFTGSHSYPTLSLSLSPLSPHSVYHPTLSHHLSPHTLTI